MVKKIAAAIIVLALLGFVAFWMAQHGSTDNVKNIEFIKSHCYNGKVLDMQNEISVRSPDDVKWYYDSYDTIVIEYGKILLKYTISDFVKAETQKDLNDVFISVKQHPETLELRVFFQEKEIPEYVKR